MPRVPIDPAKLQQVFINLFLNAMQAMPKNKGAITVRTEYSADENEVRIIVADQGEGIPASVLGQLGRRFVRQDASRSRQSGGAGLGLAITQGIVRLHGGSLTIESAEGRGTVAKITIPAS